ncbi:MAG TPA: DUF2007 domain-containing protein [Actinomycetota bacterium]|nr:DUF2007 domain-containing protein [Actinomycetota bacterium]
MKVGIDLPAPPGAAPWADGGSEWVRLTRAANDIDAHLLTGRLGEAGVETRFVKDTGAPGSWLYGGSNPWAPVTILVRRFQIDDARVVLAEIAYESPALDPHVAGAAAPHFPLRWWVAALTLGVLFSAGGLVRVARIIEARHGRCTVPLVCRSAP